MSTLLDWGNIEGEIRSAIKSTGLERRETFSLYCISFLLGIDYDDAIGCVTDGSNDRGVDAVYIDSRPDRRSIHLFQFKCHSEFSKKRNFPSSEVDKILSFLSDCFKKTQGFEHTCNEMLKLKVYDIWDFINEGQCDIIIHLCSNGDGLNLSERKRFESSLEIYKFVSLRETTLESLSLSISRQSIKGKTIKINPIDEQKFERTDGSVRALVCNVRAAEFIESLVNKVDNKSLDKNFFEENIRVYLGEKNEINQKIYNSAISSEASHFWYLNNGITIVCDKFSYQPNFSDTPITLVNPQIVNGGQTTFAIFQALDKSFNSLRDVKLMIRVIETNDSSMYSKIAEATNSQTPIRSRDLRANDLILLKLENSLLKQGWHLDRKRNQHSNISKNERIDALKLGQLWLAYVKCEPDKSKTASDRIFGEYFEFIFDPNEMSPDRVVMVWKLYIDMERHRQTKIFELRQNNVLGKYDQESSWIVEGLYHLAYMVNNLAKEKSIDIFDYDNIRGLIPEAEARLNEYIKGKPNVSTYRLFRSAETKNRIVSESKLYTQGQLTFGF